jgi:hypothetical protein
MARATPTKAAAKYLVGVVIIYSNHCSSSAGSLSMNQVIGGKCGAVCSLADEVSHA